MDDRHDRAIVKYSNGASCHNVDVYDFYKMLSFLGDGYDSLAWFKRSSDSLRLCFNHYRCVWDISKPLK